MRNILSTVTLTTLLAFASSMTNASDMEESWTLELDDSCNKFTLELPLPALNATCDLDKESGNPSKWFNPFETCALEFDMIGLPSLGDIAAGISGQICDAIKEVKSNTIDEVISDINQAIPDDIYGDINGEYDFTDDLTKGAGDATTGGSSGGGSWTDNNEAQPDQDTNRCYTTDTSGSTITVPCDISQPNPNSQNACYLKSDEYGSPFSPVACSRFSFDDEICIARWEADSNSNIKMPVLSQCTAALRASESEACSDENGNKFYCREKDQPTQNDRLCRFTGEDGDGRNYTYYDSCYKVEKACYGHINGLFQAAQCQMFHDDYYRQNSTVYDDFWS